MKNTQPDWNEVWTWQSIVKSANLTGSAAHLASHCAINDIKKTDNKYVISLIVDEAGEHLAKMKSARQKVMIGLWDVFGDMIPADCTFNVIWYKVKNKC